MAHKCCTPTILDLDSFLRSPPISYKSSIDWSELRHHWWRIIHIASLRWQLSLAIWVDQCEDGSNAFHQMWQFIYCHLIWGCWLQGADLSDKCWAICQPLRFCWISLTRPLIPCSSWPSVQSSHVLWHPLWGTLSSCMGLNSPAVCLLKPWSQWSMSIQTYTGKFMDAVLTLENCILCILSLVLFINPTTW